MTGRKRHIVVDTEGLMLCALVHATSVQDRDGAVPLLKEARRLFPWQELIWADGGYRGGKLRSAFNGLADWRLEIVTRNTDTKNFKILPRRWVVEHTFAWLGRSRSLAKDFDKWTETSRAYISIAMIQLMVRRLAKA